MIPAVGQRVLRVGRCFRQFPPDFTSVRPFTGAVFRPRVQDPVQAQLK
ncbi:Hypp2337 [Branchiostoma lanceolatum]|uniref:Hypp2337 protein n=1 Tax=Branchiostoma lanceolatum TaxID=7740 RepID=A0A8K0EPL3_BRALA|nr:Hypp2337 [Branchiostoma lanceolatum]